MRLHFSSDQITNTVILDEYNRPLYATVSTTYLRHTQILKFTPGNPKAENFATIDFHNFSPDYFTVRGEKLKVKDFLERPELTSNRRVFTLANGTAYEVAWANDIMRLAFLNGPEVGRSHVYLAGPPGYRPQPSFVEFSDDPRVSAGLDELILVYVYTRFRHENDVTRDRRDRSSGFGGHHGGTGSISSSMGGSSTIGGGGDFGGGSSFGGGSFGGSGFSSGGIGGSTGIGM